MYISYIHNIEYIAIKTETILYITKVNMFFCILFVTLQNNGTLMQFLLVTKSPSIQNGNLLPPLLKNKRQSYSVTHSSSCITILAFDVFFAENHL